MTLYKQAESKVGQQLGLGDAETCVHFKYYDRQTKVFLRPTTSQTV